MESKVKYFLSFDCSVSLNNSYAICDKMEFKTLGEMQAFKNYLESIHEGKKIYFKMWFETTLITKLF